MKNRLLPGILIVGIFLPLLYVGGLPFRVAAFLLACIGFYEYTKMNECEKHTDFPLFSGVVIIAMLFYANAVNLPMEIIIIFYTIILLMFSLFSKVNFGFEKVGYMILGVLYIAFGFAWLSEMRDVKGFGFVFFVILAIWVTDSGAYFIGKKFGKTKLYEAISPNKTIEGAFGGIIATIALGLVFYSITDYFVSVYHVLFLGLVISVCSQVGDLLESALKRQNDVKDSGTLLGGHGGILDRFDSTIFVCLILFLVDTL